MRTILDPVKEFLELAAVVVMEKRQYTALAISGFFILFLSFFFIVRTPAFVVTMNGDQVMTVKSKMEFQSMLGDYLAQQKAIYGDQLITKTNFEFGRVFVSRKNLSDTTMVADFLNQQMVLKVNAAAVHVNDQAVVFCKDVATAQDIIDQLKAMYSITTDAEILKTVGFEENIEIVQVEISADQLMDPTVAIDYITMGESDPIKYVVKEGDSLWQIARNNDIYVDDLMQANKLANDKLSLGQELIITQMRPYINVVAVVEGEQYETIPYSTETITDYSARSGVTVKQAGQDGEKFVAYVDTRKNGMTADRQLIEETVITEPQKQILVKGGPATVASRGGVATVAGYSNPGNRSLIWPTNGVITQYFKGSAHPAIDIANRSMPTLMAADTGVVSFAGWNGGYGNLVTVDHGNGMVTRYAHCSSISVSVGQSVSQGQKIGVMGSTGNSTGTHLHFEVIVGGSFMNPLNYLP